MTTLPGACPSSKTIQAALAPFEAQVGPHQTDQIRAYVSLLLKWNQVVSLTTVTDPLEILTRHFGESFFAANFVDLSHGRLADVGSGAGFPGLALKILRPEIEVTLIDSNGRKCAFLKEIARFLNLKGVRVVQQRLEQYDVGPQSFDFVCVRAFGQIERLLKWTRGALRPTGSLLLWLGQDDAMRVSAHPGWNWDATHRIPGSDRRVILVGKPRSR